jgi:hypothetical protein
VWLIFRDSRAWCAQVILTPDANKIIVFSNGIDQGSITGKPIGGHTLAIHMVGPKDDVKNAQKNPPKNITSDNINNLKPIFNPR